MVGEICCFIYLYLVVILLWLVSWPPRYAACPTSIWWWYCDGSWVDRRGMLLALPIFGGDTFMVRELTGEVCCLPYLYLVVILLWLVSWPPRYAACPTYIWWWYFYGWWIDRRGMLLALPLFSGDTVTVGELTAEVCCLPYLYLMVILWWLMNWPPRSAACPISIWWW